MRVEGNRIVGEDGETVILRGANLENWQWIWNESESLSEILAFERVAIPVLTGDAPAGWGANAVHIDVSVMPFIDGDLMYMTAVDELVALAKANGAYTVMSLRYEGILDEPVFPTQLIEDGAAVIAGRYSDEPAVLYVLGSEPRQISWTNLKPRLETMLDALRANHPRALAFLPGTEWSRYVFHVLDDPIDRQNFAIQVSTFDTWEIVQSGDGGFFKPLRLDEVAAVYPLLVGGFGVSPANISGSNWMREVEELRNFSGFLEENGVSWTAWLFNDSGCPCLLEKPWQDFTPTDWGAVLKDLM